MTDLLTWFVRLIERWDARLWTPGTYREQLKTWAESPDDLPALKLPDVRPLKAERQRR